MAGQAVESSFSLSTAEFEAALKEAAAKMVISTNKALDVLGIQVANRAKEYAPVKTGRLRNSIMSVPGDDDRGHFVDVGSFGVRYAIFIEYGTSKMRAQEFLRPALLENLNWAPKI